MSLIPNKLTNRNRKIVNPCKEGIHKYRRFTLKNKTFRTDCYFCANCGKQVKHAEMFGKVTTCWVCETVFKYSFMFNHKFPVYPKCERCSNKKRGKGIEINVTEIERKAEKNLDFLENVNEDKQEEKIINKEDLIDQLLKEAGLK